jgi:GntR family transcriptional repressor for pyruvate dehydrogenase complex
MSIKRNLRVRADAVADLEPVSRVSVKDTVMERLLGLIRDRRLGPGDKLPTEIVLCEALGVGRSSMREAVSALGSYGLLVRRPGDGTYLTSDLSNLVIRPLQFRLMLDADELSGVFEARRVLEGELAFLAAQRVDAEGMKEIDLRLKLMRERARDPEASSRADFDFHMAIARAARNPVLLGVVNHISELIFSSHLTTVDRRGLRPKTMAIHDKIADAIRRRAPEEARKIMIEHIVTAEHHALQRLARVETETPRK